MNKDYVLHIAESKARYHKQRAVMPYEEKFKIILELQKIDFEMKHKNKSKKRNIIKNNIWVVE